MRSSEYTVLSDVVRHHAKGRPEQPAIIFEDRVCTYSQLDIMSGRIAAGLKQIGVGTGDRVCILSKNSDRFLQCLFGANKIGAVFTPISWRLAPSEINYVIDHSRAKVLIVQFEFLPLLAELIASDLQTSIVLGGAQAGYVEFENWLPQVPETTIEFGQGATSVALQMYTSGTTGRPKGAMITNANLSKECDLEGPPTPEWYRCTPEDVRLLCMPMFHIGGVDASLRSLFSGGRLVVLPEFNAERVIATVERLRVTSLGLVPSALQAVLNHPSAAKANFTSLKTLFYGASPMPLNLLRQAMDKLQCSFVQCYGMTESTSTVVTLPPSDHNAAVTPRMSSAGIPLPGTEIKVVDRAGSAQLEGSIGEVLVRSRAVMAGYWAMPEATAAAIDPDGWFKTGDAGYIDGDGYLYICDRVKDMIISGGENIYPVEVEDAINSHPQVSEVAVIGVPDEKWGEAVKAIVVPRTGQTIDVTELVQWTKLRIASFKAPRSIDIVAQLPRNASGKVLKTELRKPYWAGRSRRVN